MSNAVRITVEGQDPAAVRTVVNALSILLSDSNSVTTIENQDGDEFDTVEYAKLTEEAVMEAGGDEGLQLEDLSITLVEHITFEG
jgi:hypothetical protein